MYFSRTSSGNALVALSWTCEALRLAFTDAATEESTLQKLVSQHLNSSQEFAAVKCTSVLKIFQETSLETYSQYFKT